MIPKRAAHLPLAEAILAWVTELPAAALVVVEVAILLAGVVSRYVFNNPFVWTDELAETLFIWLAMLGSVVALRRGEHMRLTTLVKRASPAVRAWLETMASVVVAIFLLEIVAPAQEYVAEQNAILTPALQMHDSYRVAALLVGSLLMLAVALLRLAARETWKQALGALGIALIAGGLLWMAKPALIAMGNANLVVFFVVIVAICVAIGVPIAFAFGVATLSYLSLTTSIPLSVVVGRMNEGMSGLVLLAVPLFVLLGLLIEMTGIARVMVDFMAAMVGHIRGGLGYVLLGAMYLVSGISGSKAADMAAVAPVLFPEMKKRGTPPGELIALLSSSGAMAETIPPSLVLIIIGSVTGVSIAALFTGGLLPAAVAALALVVVVYLRSRNDKTELAARPSAAHIAKTFVIALPGLVLPFLIRAVVLEGIATATEVSTVGIVYAVLVGLVIYRRFDWKRVLPMLVETASLSGAILLIIGTATAMAWALTQSGFSQQLAASMAHVPGGKGGFFAISIVAFAVLGSVLEGIPAIVLFGPLLFPIARELGVNEVHYAIVVILAMGLGLFAPPFGVGFYAACAVGKVSPDESMGRIVPYLFALLLALIVVAAVPWLTTGFIHTPH
ncbi:MAG TPA: TRAP transporter large permease subunit [Candidatus Dormibacteraeota bacterium]|nr:TRAP transporter large permease subunit [Candidatus Dormibacteraeota bacterium]